jgi:hypothetical protein
MDMGFQSPVHVPPGCTLGTARRLVPVPRTLHIGHFPGHCGMCRFHKSRGVVGPQGWLGVLGLQGVLGVVDPQGVLAVVGPQGVPHVLGP